MEGVGVAAVERAFAILGSFMASDESLSLAELSERTGLYKSTILRLIGSLERFGYIVRLASGRYRLGPTLLHLGGIYQRSLRLEDHILPVLRDLTRRTGESASFYTREGDTRLCLFRIDSPQSIRDHVQVGDVLPLDRGAAGRVLLAFAEGADPSVKLPVTTIGERDPHTAALAAPVFGSRGELIGAVSLSGPKSRFTRAVIAGMSGDVLAAAEDLTAKLGGQARIPARRSSGR